MSDIKLFRTNGATVTQLEGHSVALEKSLQTLIEKHLDVFLGIRFLSSEHATGWAHGGRIDTLGIDEDGCPCIIEYKRSSNENVINQGLFYLDWLLDHKGDFELLVLNRYGRSAANEIEWSTPRLLCIAGDFTKYDEHAVQQINRNIELLRYLRFGTDLLLLELVNTVQATATPVERTASSGTSTFVESLVNAGPELNDLYETLKATLLGFGSDVQIKIVQLYAAFKRLKNFASVVVHAGQNKLVLFVKVDPDTIDIEEGFTRDVRNIGHWGTGDLEITLRRHADLEKAIPLLEKSYEAN